MRLTLPLVGFIILAGCREAPTEENHNPPLASAVGAKGGTQVEHVVSNGDFVALSMYGAASSVYLQVWCADPRGDAQVYYGIQNYSPFQLLEWGEGTVPCAELNGSGTGRASLHINTTGSNFIRLAGAGGDIDLVWTKTSGYYQRSTGSSESRYPEYTFRTNGTTERSSAHVTGTMFGTAIDSYQAEMGKNHHLQIYVARNQ
jgi:hypothetical protein